MKGAEMTLKRFWKSVLIKQEENGAFLLLASQEEAS